MSPPPEPSRTGAGGLVALVKQAPAGGPDPYEAALRASGWDAVLAEPLVVTFAESGPLARALARPEAWSGLVLTSPRAALALARAGLPIGWQGRTAWTVGEETAREASRLGLRSQGAHAGRADALASLIVEAWEGAPNPGPEASGLSSEVSALRSEVSALTAEASTLREEGSEASVEGAGLAAEAADRAEARPLLFPCGARRREALPQLLAEAGVPLVEVVVYASALRRGPLFPSGCAPEAVCFFSPSGVRAALADEAFPWNNARRLAIGPTTAEALAQAGRPAHAVAAHPTPAAFVEALRQIPDPRPPRTA